MLIRLIKSEIKKIFKIKMNIVLLIIAILGTSGFVGLKYFEYSSYMPLQNQQGENIENISLLRYADNIRHQYTGEWTLEKSKQYNKDYQELIKKYKANSKINEQEMESHYGKDYQYLLDKYNNNDLTTKDYFEYVEKNDLWKFTDDSFYEGDMNSLDLWDLIIYYQADELIDGIKTAYIDGYGRSDRKSIEVYIKMVNDLLIDKNLNIDSKEGFEEYNISNGFYITDFVDDVKVYLEEQAKSLPNTFDSTIPNQMIIDAMDNTLWISFICIIIILANTFGIERQYNMEQIIYPTKASVFRVTIAKIVTGTLISFVIMVLTMLSCLLVSYVLLPVHTWNIAIIGGDGIKIAYTYLDILIYTFALGIMCSFATACLSLVLSFIIKNRFAVIITMFIYFGSIIFLNIQGIYRLMHPYIMLHSYEYFSRFESFTYIGDKITPYRDIVLVGWLIIITITFVAMILRSKMKPARTVQ